MCAFLELFFSGAHVRGGPSAPGSVEVASRARDPTRVPRPREGGGGRSRGRRAPGPLPRRPESRLSPAGPAPRSPGGAGRVPAGGAARSRAPPTAPGGGACASRDGAPSGERPARPEEARAATRRARCWSRPAARALRTRGAHRPRPLARGSGLAGSGSGLNMDEDGGGGEGGGVPEDLSLEEREELLDIRRRKKELIDDIERLKYEIAEVMTEIDNLTSVEESKTTQRNKQIAMGRKKFNMDPKKGIQFLIENDLLQSSPEDVAQFLYKGEGLNKTVIGDYLGERDDFNIKVLQAFVELHEFADLNLVQALRQFLWSFRLPGEAQKIDRMMEAFASRYCLCNPGVFQSTDTCYVLSFAIIMLNTSLHNHNVRDKPTAERFVTMNRGINEGGDLPEELLRNLYESIKNEPFKIPEDDGNDLTHTFFNPDREGWLLKLGGRVKTWKRRWFILTDNCLYYFEYTTDKEPRGIIPLENLSIREVEDPRKPNCFELYNPSHKGQVIKACKTEADGRVVEGNHVVYRISAPSPEEKEEWMKSIRASISRDPFYDMLATRKRRIANKK
ncbi:cytohesin-3 isoform X1 [Acinonyx jubatus]|uniref:Cytohesin-3 isoform X1 n=4 Tax=Carnivora TaxID=33554 RepID=A0A6J1Y061_ACIJB|nr:cytohesin-3 isoform X1 [Acinonyx jubatus]